MYSGKMSRALLNVLLVFCLLESGEGDATACFSSYVDGEVKTYLEAEAHR